MQKNVKALLFDMDGTLVDSHVIVIKAWQQFAKRHNLDLNKVLSISHGRPSVETVRMFLDDKTLHAKEALIIDEINLVEDGERAIPGVLELLTNLPMGSWAIVTSASNELALKRLKEANLPIPKVLIAEDHVKSGKPNPEGYLKAAKLLGVDPSECIIFEDAPAGVMAGNKANIQVIVVGDNQYALELPHIINIKDFSNVDITISNSQINLVIHG